MNHISEDINNFCNLFKFSLDIKKEKNNFFGVLQGDLPINDALDGFIWDTFNLSIIIDLSYYHLPCRQNPLSKSYPYTLPLVMLNDHNYMKTQDRHIDNNGICCLAPNVECQLILGKDYSLIDFLRKLVVPFFGAQIYFDKTNKWPNGDFSHNKAGLLEYYTEKLKLPKHSIIPALEILIGLRKIGRNDKCICDSNKKYKYCHIELIDKIKFKVTKEAFKYDYEIITKN